MKQEKAEEKKRLMKEKGQFTERLKKLLAEKKKASSPGKRRYTPEQLSVELDILPDNDHSDEEGEGYYLYPDPAASQLGWYRLKQLASIIGATHEL
jgi:hypothetical protein